MLLYGFKISSMRYPDIDEKILGLTGQCLAIDAVSCCTTLVFHCNLVSFFVITLDFFASKLLELSNED